MAKELPIARSILSEHLKELKKSGLQMSCLKKIFFKFYQG